MSDGKGALSATNPNAAILNSLIIDAPVYETMPSEIIANALRDQRQTNL